MRVVLALGVVCFVLLLLVAPKPWSDGVALKTRLGANLDVRDYVVTYGWWAAAGNAVLLAALLGTERLWLRLGRSRPIAKLRPPKRPSAAWVVVVLAAAATAGGLAWPRLSQSLLIDEAYSVRRSIDGYWKHADGRKLAFKEADWLDTLWYYRMPTNHVPHTILARIHLEAWQATSASGGVRFDERVLRIPAYVAGLLSIASAATLLWRIGFPAAGAVLAWLMALHPWHVRYMSEARGYSMLLLLVTAQLTLLVASLHRGSWPRWLAYGAVQGLLLWVYPLAVHLVWITNLAALVALVRLRRGTPELRTEMGRLLVVNVLGAIAWLQLMAPNVGQLLVYLEEAKAQGEIGRRWLTEFASYLLYGKPWRVPMNLGDHYPQLRDVVTGRVPAHYLVGALVASAALALGALRMWRRGPLARGLAFVLLVPGPATAAFAWIQGYHLWEWYLIFMLPTWGALVALGATWAFDASTSVTARAASAATLLLLLGGFAAVTHEPRDVLRSRAAEPRRDSVAMARPHPDPTHPSHDEILTVSFGADPSLYDPRSQPIDGAPDLLAAMARSEREGRALYVNVSLLLTRRVRPDLAGLLNDREHFVEVGVLHGFEPKHSRAVYRYLGSSGPGPRADGQARPEG